MEQHVSNVLFIECGEFDFVPRPDHYDCIVLPLQPYDIFHATIKESNAMDSTTMNSYPSFVEL